MCSPLPSDSKDVLPTPRLTNVHGGDGGNNEEKGNNGELMSNMNPGGSVHYPLREARKSCGRREQFQFHARSLVIGRKCVCVLVDHQYFEVEASSVEDHYAKGNCYCCSSKMALVKN